MSSGVIVATSQQEVFLTRVKIIKQNNKLSQSLVTFSMLLNKVRLNSAKILRYSHLNREISKYSLIIKRSKRIYSKYNSVKFHWAKSSSKMLESNKKPRRGFPQQIKPRQLDSLVRISLPREGTSVQEAILVFRTKLNLKQSTYLKRISLISNTAHPTLLWTIKLASSSPIYSKNLLSWATIIAKSRVPVKIL